MTQDEFIALRNGEWAELDGLLLACRQRGAKRLQAHEVQRLGALYRALSGDLARAEAQHFSGDLLAVLERLAARAHSTLYAAPPWRPRAVWEFLATGFPTTLRRQGRFFGVAALLFLVPMMVTFVAAWRSPSFALHVLPASALSQAADSYGEAFGGGRAAGEGALMTGFYINHNISIAFQCFATGVFFGLGSVFFLVYNGAVIGTVLGYVVRLGFGANILSFVVGHSPFELTAIVISGAAGLRMGYALVNTGGRTRLGSLRAHGTEILTMVLGAASMLVVAALIEGLWSASTLPRGLKFATGAALAVIVAVYLFDAGRRPRTLAAR